MHVLNETRTQEFKPIAGSKIESYSREACPASSSWQPASEASSMSVNAVARGSIAVGSATTRGTLDRRGRTGTLNSNSVGIWGKLERATICLPTQEAWKTKKKSVMAQRSALSF